MYFINKQISILTFYLIIIMAFLVSCSNDSDSLPSDATFVDNVYDNKFFSFSVKLPDGWYSVSKDTMEEVSNTGKDLIAGDDKNMKAGLAAAQKNVYNLFQTYQVAPGTPVEYFNSNISCVVEKVSHLPGIKSGEDYLLNAKKLLTSGQVTINFNEEIHSTNIDGTNFHVLNAVVSIMEQEIKQEYYATLLNGFILAFVINYSENEQYEATQKTINSINFY